MEIHLHKNDEKPVEQAQQPVKLTAEQAADVLRKNWLSHDARWQMAVFQQFGWEAGNRINQEVGRQMGKVAMHRLMKVLGIPNVKNPSELKKVCEVAMDLFFPPPDFEYQFEQESDTNLVGTMKRCLTYDNVRRVGVEKFYECGCFAMRAGWYEALGVKVEESIGKCLKAGDEKCEIIIHLARSKFPQKNVRFSREEG